MSCGSKVEKCSSLHRTWSGALRGLIIARLHRSRALFKVRIRQSQNDDLIGKRRSCHFHSVQLDILCINISKRKKKGWEGSRFFPGAVFSMLLLTAQWMVHNSNLHLVLRPPPQGPRPSDTTTYLKINSKDVARGAQRILCTCFVSKKKTWCEVELAWKNRNWMESEF